MPLGLLAAQVAHIAYEPIRNNTNDILEIKLAETENVNALVEWNRDPYLFVHQVGNKESLMHFYKKADSLGIPVTLWSDTVYVQLSPTQKEAFANIPIGIAIGPIESDKVRQVIGDLPLLQEES